MPGLSLSLGLGLSPRSSGASDPVAPDTTLTINNVTILIGDDEVEMA